MQTTPGHRLLMIDDDVELCALLRDYVARFGHRLVSAPTAADGWRALFGEPSRRPDLVILDLMLPDEDGLSLCRRIRAEADVPIIMLTARGDVADRVLGLELGADDYVPKPFEPRELVARIESVLRRAEDRPTGEVLRAAGLRLDVASRQVTVDGTPVDLTTMEFELLHVLMSRRGRVLSREQLLDALRGLDADVYDRAVDMLVSRLRQKLGDDVRAPRFVKTVWRVGYQFIAPVDGA